MRMVNVHGQTKPPGEGPGLFEVLERGIDIRFIQKNAANREKYLKSLRGKRYIKNRIKNYVTGSSSKTTEIYTHVSSKHVASTPSPLDSL